MNDGGAVAGTLDAEVRAFLYHEAALLDRGQIREWFDTIVHQDIRYEIPIRVTKDSQSASAAAGRGWLMQEDWSSLDTRVRRLETEYAWAEDPPTRTRRFVTNVRTSAEADGSVTAESNILVYWSRGPSDEFRLLSGERRDRLALVDGTLRLIHRLVLLDHTVLVTQNLSIFI